jgi:hypothetical protein
MTETPSGSDAQSATEPQSSLGKAGSWLKSVQGIVLTSVSICTVLAGVVLKGCNLPLFAHVCAAIGLVDDKNVKPEQNSQSSDASLVPTQDIERQIAASGIQRDPQLESVRLYVQYLSTSDGRMVQLTIAGLRAKGFSVRDRHFDPGDVVVDDKSPGKIWIKSVAAQKNLKDTVRDTILRAAPTKPSNDVKVYGPDLSSGVQRDNDIQVDIF